MASSSWKFGFKLQPIGDFFRQRHCCNGGLQVLCNGFDRPSVSWVLRDLHFLLLWGLQFAAMVVGCKDGLAGFYVDEHSLQVDESFFEGEIGSETR